MRGPLIGLAILLAAPAAATQAASPTGAPAFRPVRVPTTFSPRVVAPRPMMTRSITPRTPTSPSTRPHCPPPPVKPAPIPVAVYKPPNHKARTMRLIQQNIAMQAAMRSLDRPRPCKSSWSAEKRLRKGCLPVLPVQSPLAPEASPTFPVPLLETTLATVQDVTGGQN